MCLLPWCIKLNWLSFQSTYDKASTKYFACHCPVFRAVPFEKLVGVSRVGFSDHPDFLSFLEYPAMILEKMSDHTAAISEPFLDHPVRQTSPTNFSNGIALKQFMQILLWVKEILSMGPFSIC